MKAEGVSWVTFIILLTITIFPLWWLALGPDQTVNLADDTTVGLDSGTTVNLADDTTVGLDSGTTIGLAPGATFAFADSSNIDAFSRLRTSVPYTIFDSKLLGDNLPLLWDDIERSGSGTSSTYNNLQASVTLAVSNLTAGNRTRQTKISMNYQSGKSQLIIFTGILGSPGAGTRSRYGYFNDNNGLFFQSTGGVVSIVVRSSTSGTPIDVIIDQSAWNIDQLDGNGPSGITLDITKNQIFVIDFQWLGAGRARFGFDFNGIMYYVHEANHANLLNVVYMSTPSLPIRGEITNDGTGPAGSLTMICSTVMSEGSTSFTTANGITRLLDRGITAFAATNHSVTYPLLALRLRTNYQYSSIDITDVSILASGNITFKWSIVLNPTVTGTAFSYTILPNSSVEADTSTTNATTLTGGTVIAGGYAEHNNRGISFAFNPTRQLVMGATIEGISDVVVLTVTMLPGESATNFYGSVSFDELF